MPDLLAFFHVPALPLTCIKAVSSTPPSTTMAPAMAEAIRATRRREQPARQLKSLQMPRKSAPLSSRPFLLPVRLVQGVVATCKLLTLLHCGSLWRRNSGCLMSCEKGMRNLKKGRLVVFVLAENSIARLSHLLGQQGAWGPQGCMRHLC